MPTYQEIVSQIEDLKLKAEAIRKQEMAGAIAEIKRMMAEFEISLEDLGAGPRAAKGKMRAVSAARYRDPVSGKTWSGRGRRPGWVMNLEAQGKSLDACKIA